jgi:hypothetical protein
MQINSEFEALSRDEHQELMFAMQFRKALAFQAL